MQCVYLLYFEIDNVKNFYACSGIWTDNITGSTPLKCFSYPKEATDLLSKLAAEGKLRVGGPKFYLLRQNINFRADPHFLTTVVEKRIFEADLE